MKLLTTAEPPTTGHSRSLQGAVHLSGVQKSFGQTRAVDGIDLRNYLSSSIAKTGSRNRVEALRIAEQSGWL